MRKSLGMNSTAVRGCSLLALLFSTLMTESVITCIDLALCVDFNGLTIFVFFLKKKEDIFIVSCACVCVCVFFFSMFVD